VAQPGGDAERGGNRDPAVVAFAVLAGIDVDQDSSRSRGKVAQPRGFHFRQRILSLDLGQLGLQRGPVLRILQFVGRGGERLGLIDGGASGVGTIPKQQVEPVAVLSGLARQRDPDVVLGMMLERPGAGRLLACPVAGVTSSTRLVAVGCERDGTRRRPGLERSHPRGGDRGHDGTIAMLQFAAVDDGDCGSRLDSLGHDDALGDVDVAPDDDTAGGAGARTDSSGFLRISLAAAPIDAKVGLPGTTRGHVDAMRMPTAVRRSGFEDHAGELADELGLGPPGGRRVEVWQPLPSYRRRCRHRHLVRPKTEPRAQVVADQLVITKVGRRLQQAAGIHGLMAFAILCLDQVAAAEDLRHADLGRLEVHLLEPHHDIEDRLAVLGACAIGLGRALVPAPGGILVGVVRIGARDVRPAVPPGYSECVEHRRLATLHRVLNGPCCDPTALAHRLSRPNARLPVKQPSMLSSTRFAAKPSRRHSLTLGVKPDGIAKSSLLRWRAIC
jgi:hypothetical protein